MSITTAPAPTGDQPLAPNAYRLLWAGFMAILAAGVGFAIRGGIVNNWQQQYSFTGKEIGDILGAGLTGFCFGIIIGGVIADKVGYGKLVIAAFLFHVLSAVITFMASDTELKQTTTFANARQMTLTCLFWGMFIFSLANGVLEAVANPLVATLFPHNRTHYLNILHASWPAGLVLGGVIGWVLGEQYNVYWKDQLAIYLIPTLLYGLMFLGQPMPKSEASKQGLSLGEMFQDVGILGALIACLLLAMFLIRDIFMPLFGSAAPSGDEALDASRAANAAMLSKVLGYGIGGALLVVVAVMTKFSIGSLLLFMLFVAHALVGAVELGTDSWITNITGNLLTTGEGRILFVFASTIMFLLRFCSDFIEKKLGMSPVVILLTCAVLAFVGLQLAARINSFAFALLAIGVYAVGKTFFWPTMLAVASDQFPRTGAVAISMMGGIGMLSAGLIGGPGLGYAKDRFSGEALKEKSPALYEQYKSEKPSDFQLSEFKLGEVHGVDPGKLGTIQEKNKRAKEGPDKVPASRVPVSVMFKVKFDEGPEKPGGDAAKEPTKLTEEEKTVLEASIEGDRRTLQADSLIPAAMAVIYLGLLLYFMATGGYKVRHIDGTTKEAGH